MFPQSKKHMFACIVSRKIDTFCGRHKKKKHVSQKILFLAPNFVVLHNPNDKSIFMEGLCALLECEEDVHVFPLQPLTF
jgi:hypothetical protein